MGHAELGGPALSIVLWKSTPAAGEGEVFKKAAGDDSWLVTIAERGEASREPEVVSPFIDWVTECCYK